MLLATRPDLTWIVLVGLLVLILWFVKAILDAMEPSGGEVTPQDRRDFMESALALTVTTALAAYTLPAAIDLLESDDSESRILRIDSGETHTVDSDENETWVAVYDNGLLNLNGSMDLEGNV